MELLPLVCLCLLSCPGDAVRVVVEEDSDAVLPCLISPKENLTGELFDWKKDGQKKKEVFQYDAGNHYNNGRQGQDEQFKGRVSFFQDQLQNGNASIEITRTKMADSGSYSCGFPRHQPSQTSIIELVVDPVLRDRTGENIPGLAPKPNIDILRDTKDWVLLQCEAHGVSPLTVEWKNAAGNILKSESTPISETGSPSSITLNINVTKTDDYSCVATQKQFSHQIAAVTSVYIPGSNTEAIVGGGFGGAAIIFVVVVVIIRLDHKLRGSRPNTANRPTAADSSHPLNIIQDQFFSQMMLNDSENILSGHLSQSEE